ncbi:hypothetical protein LAZ67_21000603 [Cordylochernes scorpioides]|uniref:C2H2-type domain-containing protein n=1 Tax=Cordylochernes scorpioides TaxID=51811 RepID=A0ABY6LLL3_9ARAC|nr:hypothetical protein LAZ67_21000603 [Cordylochernes scorpioides]
MMNEHFLAMLLHQASNKKYNKYLTFADTTFAKQQRIQNEINQALNIKQENQAELINESTSGEIKPIKCSDCNYLSLNESEMALHKLLHTEIKTYKCSLCNYNTTMKSTLNRHIRTHTREKPFHCNLCDYSSSTKLGLNVHMGKHTGERPYQCPHCSYRAQLISGLKVHLKTHTGERPFQCPQCDYKASQKIHIIVHLRRHTGEKPYHCPHCDYRASQKSNLDWHSRIHTGIDKPIRIVKISLDPVWISWNKVHPRLTGAISLKPWSSSEGFSVCQNCCSKDSDISQQTEVGTVPRKIVCVSLSSPSPQTLVLLPELPAHFNWLSTGFQTFYTPGSYIPSGIAAYSNLQVLPIDSSDPVITSIWLGYSPISAYWHGQMDADDFLPHIKFINNSSPAKCELRSVIRFLNAKNNSPVEIHHQLVEVYAVWAAEFAESTVARIDEMVRANQRITLEEIEDGLNEDCSHFSVHKIVSETLGYRKVSARWVDKWLKEAAGEWYNTGITKLVDRMKKVIEHQGDYVEK